MRIQFIRSFGRPAWLLALAVATLFAAPVQAQIGDVGHLIPQSTAQRYGLTRAWFTQAALDRNRTRVGSWALQGDTLFVQTTQNIVQAIAAETGRTLWTTQVGEPGKPTGPISASASAVGVVNGSWVYLLNRQNGQVLWQREMESIPLGGVAVTDQWVYIPMSNGRMRAIPFINPDSKLEPWWRGTAGRIEDAPIATQTCVIWNNDRGLLLASELDKSHLIFQFETNRPMTAPLAYWPPYAFMVERQFVFAVDVNQKRSQGRMAWQFSPGGRISQAPVA
ncbi:MAG TPA: PQQ-binding-like beta-propeller repeat protein, partial [Pirellulales bacterium]